MTETTYVIGNHKVKRTLLEGLDIDELVLKLHGTGWAVTSMEARPASPEGEAHTTIVISGVTVNK